MIFRARGSMTSKYTVTRIRVSRAPSEEVRQQLVEAEFALSLYKGHGCESDASVRNHHCGVSKPLWLCAHQAGHVWHVLEAFWKSLKGSRHGQALGSKTLTASRHVMERSNSTHSDLPLRQKTTRRRLVGEKFSMTDVCVQLPGEQDCRGELTCRTSMQLHRTVDRCIQISG